MLNLVRNLAVFAAVMAPFAKAADPFQGDFCSSTGFVVSNGTQIKNGSSCSNTILGAIPATDLMVSTVILAPENGAVLPLNTSVEFKVHVFNIELGGATNSSTQYYIQPQTLNDQGQVIGHVHLVAQRLPEPGQPLDSSVYEFAASLSKKPEDPTSNVLSAKFDAGFNKTGTFRICTMANSKSHQPVIMPVGTRGSTDDCIRIRVGEDRSSALNDQMTEAERKVQDAQRKLQEAQAKLDQLGIVNDAQDRLDDAKRIAAETERIMKGEKAASEEEKKLLEESKQRKAVDAEALKKAREEVKAAEAKLQKAQEEQANAKTSLAEERTRQQAQEEQTKAQLDQELEARQQAASDAANAAASAAAAAPASADAQPKKCRIRQQ
jgi:hypothetical protein